MQYESRAGGIGVARGTIVLLIFGRYINLITIIVGRWQMLPFSDEPEPSWLEPGLELNNFQLDSARLVTFTIQLGNFPIKARKLA